MRFLGREVPYIQEALLLLLLDSIFLQTLTPFELKLSTAAFVSISARIALSVPLRTRFAHFLCDMMNRTYFPSEFTVPTQIQNENELAACRRNHFSAALALLLCVDPSGAFHEVSRQARSRRRLRFPCQHSQTCG